MKFSQTAQLTDPELVISRLHDKWLVEEGGVTNDAIEFMDAQLRKKQRVRRGTVSASSLGGCIRAQQFVYIGVPKKKEDVKGLSIFGNGDFVHLRWQMWGISAGWLSQAEVPVPENEYSLAGTMDGTLFNEDVVEIKSINDNGFKGVISFGPQKKHLLQGAAYLLASGRDRVVYLYENKNDQEYREFVRSKDELPMEDAKARAEQVHYSNDMQQLAEPLKPCERREGFEYNYCPFRNICLETKDWDDAVRQARGA